MLNSPLAYYGKRNGEGPISHSKLGFIEPLMHFTPAIAPSGLYKFLGNKSLEDKNYYFMTSLAGEWLFLIKFSENYEKVDNIEKTELNERIRSMLYIKNKNLYLL